MKVKVAAVWQAMGPSSARVPNREELKKLIEGAFAADEYPGDNHLVCDTSGYHLECNEVSAAFRGRDWREIPLELLRRESSAPHFMTPAAYRYFLPAYLMASIMNYEEADLIPDTVVHILISPCDEKDLEDYRRRMEWFTAVQRQAIVAFLRFMKANYSDDDVLGDLDHALNSVVDWGG